MDAQSVSLPATAIILMKCVHQSRLSSSNCWAMGALSALALACVDIRCIAMHFCSFDEHKFSECNWSASRPIHVNKFSIQAIAKFMNSVRSQSAQIRWAQWPQSAAQRWRHFSLNSQNFFFPFFASHTNHQIVERFLRRACQLYPDWNLIGGIFRYDDAWNWQSIWMAHWSMCDVVWEDRTMTEAAATAAYIRKLMSNPFARGDEFIGRFIDCELNEISQLHPKMCCASIKSL